MRLRESVRDLHLKKWTWPLGRWKWRPARGGPGEGEVCGSAFSLTVLSRLTKQLAGLPLVDARMHRPVRAGATALDSGVRHRRSDRLLLPRFVVAQVCAHLVFGGDQHLRDRRDVVRDNSPLRRCPGSPELPQLRPPAVHAAQGTAQAVLTRPQGALCSCTAPPPKPLLTSSFRSSSASSRSCSSPSGKNRASRNRPLLGTASSSLTASRAQR